MNRTHDYENGTSLIFHPMRGAIGGRAICPDGRVRALRNIGQPDTYWTIPCSVSYKGTTVRGYVAIEDGAVVFNSRKFEEMTND